jgi:hypothetical protein
MHTHTHTHTHTMTLATMDTKKKEEAYHHSGRGKHKGLQQRRDLRSEEACAHNATAASNPPDQATESCETEVRTNVKRDLK